MKAWGFNVSTETTRRHFLGQIAASAAVALAAVSAFGRGEWWVPKPPAPPPVETLTNETRYLEWKWREDVTDPKTGVTQEQAKEKLFALSKERESKDPWNVVKAECFAWLCDNLAIDVSPLDWFPAFACWNRYVRPMSPVLSRRNGEIGMKFYPETLRKIEAGNHSGKWTIWKDFDHSVPEWEKTIPLGFPGTKARLLASWRDGDSYYLAEKITAEGIDRLLERLIECGEKRLSSVPSASSPTGAGKRAVAETATVRLQGQIESLRRLRNGAPQTAYDVMQFIYLGFVLSEHFEAVQARSLSTIEKVLWPYYRADLAAGRTTEAEFREQFRHFLWQWGSIDNYWGQPVTMGGTKEDGTTEYNPLSRVILDVMDECALPTPKFHLKVADNMPEDILDRALAMVRRHRPISFVGEKGIRRVMLHYGYTEDEARRAITRGCYEFCCPEGANRTGVGYVNVLKAVETSLASASGGGFAAATFEEFAAACEARTVATLREACEVSNVFERHLADVNPPLVTSLMNENSIRTGRDAFADGTARGNNTGLLIVGFATAVDALLAVKEIVYERREMTLAELGLLMAANWRGREDLRLRMQRSKRKWGTNDPEANALGARLAKAFSGAVNGKPNARGGFFCLSGHSARQFVEQGRVLGATPDGRKAGDEVSKNLSASVGADTEGATALVMTLASLDARDFPGDFPLDVVLLPSASSGEKGVEAMKAIVRTYVDNGGVVIQFNVFDAAELKDAQKHPEKYENLQVRVCGWNVRWNDLPKDEQDAYIRRAEEIAR